RAARNVDSKVIMYADKMTRSMQAAIDETNRRRSIQVKHNIDNNITPKTISSRIVNSLAITQYEKVTEQKNIDSKNIIGIIKDLEASMRICAQSLDFESAAKLRDDILELKIKYNLQEEKSD
ncbi:MAG: UvrB/UvrC motif-containing protein, partial [Clostridiales bacterium]|nr:UvrB/UvrC motif-containing protein [Clostridiales bacterium]